MNSKFDALIAFVRFLGIRKKYWLLPVVLMLLLLGILFVATQGSVIVPFIYPLF